jgi:hydroxysqualene synthase
MMEIADASSGKTHRNENFPVASVLIAPQYRPPILAFYDFVRAADDISDHASLPPDEKLALLDRLDADLLSPAPKEAVAARLAAELRARKLDPQHARDLIVAFKRDVTQLRYRDWDDLIDYCRYSAMPVGRYVLDVHGEDASATWPANDALCAALQIVNHLQDCGKDYKNIDRVYVPQDALAQHGASVDMLGAAHAPAPLLDCIHALARRTQTLLAQSRPFADLIDNTRLAMEVGAIQHLAETLTADLVRRDPLSEKVHASKTEFLFGAAMGAGGALLRRLFRPARRAATEGAR